MQITLTAPSRDITNEELFVVAESMRRSLCKNEYVSSAERALCIM